jgi:hypothetical protein
MKTFPTTMERLESSATNHWRDTSCVDNSDYWKGTQAYFNGVALGLLIANELPAYFAASEIANLAEARGDLARGRDKVKGYADLVFMRKQAG